MGTPALAGAQPHNVPGSTGISGAFTLSAMACETAPTELLRVAAPKESGDQGIRVDWCRDGRIVLRAVYWHKGKACTRQR